MLHILPKAAYTLGLTATAFVDPEGAELAYLEGKLNARVHNSEIDSRSLYQSPVQHIEDFESFFNKTKDDEAKLIYANKSDFNIIEKMAQVYSYSECIKNCQDAKIIGNIGRRVLVVTSECELYMRGIDYRSRHISLLIADGFSNERAY